MIYYHRIVPHASFCSVIFFIFNSNRMLNISQIWTYLEKKTEYKK